MLKPAERTFLPQEFCVTDWDQLQPFFDELLSEALNSAEDLVKWMKKVSELDAVIREDAAWRFIRMTCDTENKDLSERYKDFIGNILPNLTNINQQLYRKISDSEYKDELNDPAYQLLFRRLVNSLEIYREENVPLKTKERNTAREFDEVAGSLFIEEDGKKITLQKAASYLEGYDRSRRERIWKNIMAARLEKKNQLNTLFSNLISIRTEIAHNTGFDNFVGYRFKELGRFDYTPADCADFCDSIASEITPIYEKLMLERKEQLGVDQLRPWDLNVDVYGKKPLEPFESTEFLTEKTIEVLNTLRSGLGDMIRVMKEGGFLDLGSRIGKAPGGYNYPLLETGIPFIFMNAVGTQSDLTTMLHECGHAIHAFLTRDLELSWFKDTPAEIAELASMAMELITMDYWNHFYDNQEDLNRAYGEQIRRTITILPWIATIDHFQRWAYSNPGHSIDQRQEEWVDIFFRYHGEAVDWVGCTDELSHFWQKQGHLYDAPFYYIEYGIAQLGALGVWKNYKENPEKGLDQYLDALRLGYMRSIPEVYETAGVKFDFTQENIRKLAAFVLDELKAFSPGLKSSTS